MVEVDRERGRIGLRLHRGPAVAGKTPGGAGLGRQRRRGRSWRRWRRTRCVADAAAVTAAAVDAPRAPPARLEALSALPEGIELTELDGGLKVVTEAVPGGPLGRPRALGANRIT